MQSITMEKRDPAAKGKQLRRSGIIPCVIYGNAYPDSLHVQADKEAVRQLLRRKREGSVVDVIYDGRRIPSLIKAIEHKPAANEVIHISFHAFDGDKRVKSKALIELENRDVIAGIPQQILYEVEYSALPEDLFDSVTIDLTQLPLGTVLTVGDIPEFCSDKIELITGAENVALKICDRKHGANYYTAQ